MGREKGKGRNQLEEEDFHMDVKEDEKAGKKGKEKAKGREGKKGKAKTETEEPTPPSAKKGARKSRRLRGDAGPTEESEGNPETAGSPRTSQDEPVPTPAAHDEDDHEDDDDDDEEEGRPRGMSDAELAAMLSFGDGFGFGGAGASNMQHMGARFKAILPLLKQKGDSTQQMVALQELSELLSVATEDMFIGHGGSRVVGFNADEYVKVLIDLLNHTPTLPPGVAEDFPLEYLDDFGFGGGAGGMNPELMLLACRCLANLIEALPSSSLQIVHHGGVQVLIGKLTKIEYIDLAEQVLSVLEKISRDYSAAIVFHGGLSAVLQYIDFFSLHVQRTAITTAANACTGLASVARGSVPGLNSSPTIAAPDQDRAKKGTEQVNNAVKEVLPTLERLLSNADQKIVEQAVTCLFRIVEWCWKTESTLESLITVSLLQTIVSMVNPNNISSGSAASNASVFTKLVKTLANVAKGSATLCAALLTEMNIVDTICGFLTGGVMDTANAEATVNADNVSTAVMNVVVNRPHDQILEVLGLASDILPTLPTDGVWDLKAKRKDKGKDATAKAVSAAETAIAQMKIAAEERNIRLLARLKSESTALNKYSSFLLHIFIEVFGATVNSSIRRKVVECVAKAVWYPDDIDALSQTMLKTRGFGKLVSELIGFREVAFGTGGNDRERRDAILLVAAGVQIASVVVDRCGPNFRSWFGREGVWEEINVMVESIRQQEKQENLAREAAKEAAKQAAKEAEKATGEGSSSESKDAPGEGAPAGGPSAVLSELRRLRGQIGALDTIASEAESETGSDAGAVGAHDDVLRQVLDEVTAVRRGKTSEGTEATRAAVGSSSTSAPAATPASASLPAASGPGSSSASLRELLERLSSARASMAGFATTSGLAFPPPPMGSSSVIIGLNNERYSEREVRSWLKHTGKALKKAASPGKEQYGGDVLDRLRKLSDALNGEGPDDLTLGTLQQIAQYFAGSNEESLGMGVTGFEILESGMMEALSLYLTQGAVDDITPHDAAQKSKFKTPLAVRLRAFIHVFMNGPTPDLQTRNYFVPNAFRRVVQLLLESLSRTERFEVASAVPSHSFAYEAGYSPYMTFGAQRGEAFNPSLQLARTLRLKLVAEEPDTVPRTFENTMINVHAVATYKAVEEYLKPRVAEGKEKPADVATGGADVSGSASAKPPLDGSSEAGKGPQSGESTEGNKGPQPSAGEPAGAAADEPELNVVDDDGDVVMAEAGEHRPSEGEQTSASEDEEADEGAEQGEGTEEGAVMLEEVEVGHADGQAGEGMSDEDVEGDLYDYDDEDDSMDHMNVQDLLLHSEEAQRRRRSQQEGAGDGNPTSPTEDETGLAGRRDSVVDVRTEPPSSQASSSTAPTPPAAPLAANSTSPAADKGKGPAADEPPTSSAPAPRSYAAAASASTNYEIEFSIGGNSIAKDTTIFGSLYQYERDRSNNATPNVWSRTYEVRYRKVYPSQTTSTGTEADTPMAEAAQLTPKRGRQRSHMAVKLPFAVDMSSSIDVQSPPGKILYLLRLLYGLNTRWAEVYADLDADSLGASAPSLFEASQPAIRKAVTATDAPVNVSALPVSMFANNKLTAKLNRQLDEPLIVAAHVLPSWCASVARDFSFLVPFETRLVYLQSTSFGYSRSMTRWQQQQNQGRAGSAGGRGGSGESPVLGRVARQKVRIQRSRMFDSMLKVMELYGSGQPLLEVEFFDEIGAGLGPTLEFYAVVSKEIQRRSGVQAYGPGGVAERYTLWRSDDTVVEGTKEETEKVVGKAGEEEVDENEYLKPALGLFPAPLSKADLEGPRGKRVLQLFTSIGTFVAKALLDSRIVDLPFSPMFLEMVVGEEEEEESAAEEALGPVGRKGAEFHLLRHVDPALYISLRDLKKYAHAKQQIDKDTTLSPTERQKRLDAIRVRDAKLEDLCLDFTLPGYPSVELVPNEREVAVTVQNVEQYIDLVVEMTVGEGVRKQVEAFRKGFDRVFPVRDLRSFSVQELALLVGGAADEDWSVETLIDSIKADHGYTPDSRLIRDLVEMMSTFSPAQRRDFLQFVTGSPKLPIGGFKALTPQLTVVRKTVDVGRKSDEYLPSVMTCVNYLKVPEYSGSGVMRRRFEVAMAEGQGCFHLS
ncbi:Ubiquitin fusion degradation protein 4 [Rhizophlyctis rosea]|nr:Ubiquitin fusion degradation protein 4 [Rhizophlyctis rosea]